jgi:hypothetical protein
MTAGQTVGQLIGHLFGVLGAALTIWAIGRFVIVGNAPTEAVRTALFFFYGSASAGFGKTLVWFAGGGFGQ